MEIQLLRLAVSSDLHYSVIFAYMCKENFLIKNSGSFGVMFMQTIRYYWFEIIYFALKTLMLYQSNSPFLKFLFIVNLKICSVCDAAM